MSAERIVDVCTVVYCLLGLPVAFYHMRQQNMQSSAEAVGKHGLQAVVLVLAVVWPLLLLSMLMNRLNAKGKPAQCVASQPHSPVKVPLERPERTFDPSEFDGR